MENWGLITGRTIALLFNPERGDLAAMKQVATTQSHEVAHMWYGFILLRCDLLECNTEEATLGSVILQPWNGGITCTSMKVRFYYIFFD